jgi:hypothetical protein
MARRRGKRAFLKQVADELPSHLPPKLRGFDAEQWGSFYKVWYDRKQIHFEVQFLRNGRLEIGLHMEADTETNDRVTSALERKSSAILKSLGSDTKFGAHGPGWRSIGETWSGGDLRSEDAATEAAARLGEYVTVLTPLLRSAVRSSAAGGAEPRSGRTPTR